MVGLFFFNATNDFTFYHVYGSTASCIKDVQSKYVKLLPNKFTTDINRVLDASTADSDSRHLAIITVNISRQILVGHGKDISSDSFLLRANLQAKNETLMNDAAFVNINNF